VSFDVQSQLRILVHVHGGVADLHTEGLAAIGRDELCILGAPEAQVAEAGAVLNHVAGYVANQSAVGDGERMGTDHPWGLLAVRLVREEHGSKGFLGLFGGRPGRQRVVDAWDDTDGVPWIALSTLLLWKAEQALEAEDEAQAVAFLEASLGTVTPAEGEVPTPGPRYNAGGAQAAVRLAFLQPERRSTWLHEAFRRSEAAQVQILGDTLDALANRSESRLRSRALTLLMGQLTSLEPQSAGPVVMFTGPLAMPNDGLWLDRTLLPTPVFEAVRHTHDALRSEPVRALAAKVAATWDPVDLVLATWPTQELYGESSMPVDTGERWAVGMRLLSLVLADLGVLLAGGAAPEDLPAAYDEPAPEGAGDRLEEARARVQALHAQGVMAALARP
jgi:hypothetical protein